MELSCDSHRFDKDEELDVEDVEDKEERTKHCTLEDTLGQRISGGDAIIEIDDS